MTRRGYDGRMVLIPKGTIYRSMHPQKDGDQILGRSIKVRIHHEFAGERPSVNWAGTGGYWCWTHPDNVSPLEVEE